MTDVEMAELRARALQQASADMGELVLRNQDLLLRRAEVYFTFLMRGEPRTKLDAI